MTLLMALLAMGLGDPDNSADLPRSLMEMEAPAPAPALADHESSWWIGPRIGYMEVRDADEGTWVVGGQVRWHILPFLAAEGSIEGRKDRYEDGDIKVYTIPVQLSALVYVPFDWKLRPYAVAGIGWYITRTRFSGSQVADDETDHTFGFHAGAGAEFEITPKISVNGDFRYIFIDEPHDFGESDFDGWEITVGVNFRLGK